MNFNVFGSPNDFSGGKLDIANNFAKFVGKRYKASVYRPNKEVLNTIQRLWKFLVIRCEYPKTDFINLSYVKHFNKPCNKS